MGTLLAYTFRILVAILLTIFSTFNMIQQQSWVFVSCVFLLILSILCWDKIQNYFLKVEAKKLIKKITLPQNFKIVYENNCDLSDDISDIKVYLDDNADPFAIISFYCDKDALAIEDIVNQKMENYLKPVHQILREFSFDDIKHKIPEFCYYIHTKILHSRKDINLYGPDCNYRCAECKDMSVVLKELEHIYNKLLDIPIYDSEKTIGLHKETFEGLNLQDIVNAKYKDSQTLHLGKEELMYVLINILLYAYALEQQTLLS